MKMPPQALHISLLIISNQVTKLQIDTKVLLERRIFLCLKQLHKKQKHWAATQWTLSWEVNKLYDNSSKKVKSTGKWAIYSRWLLLLFPFLKSEDFSNFLIPRRNNLKPKKNWVILKAAILLSHIIIQYSFDSCKLRLISHILSINYNKYLNM